jgi:hypothetical protein
VKLDLAQVHKKRKRFLQNVLDKEFELEYNLFSIWVALPQIKRIRES